MRNKVCENCKRECIKHAKGMCVTCYKRLHWKPKPNKCKRCKRMLPMHARGYCGGCYNSVFHLDRIKAENYKKWHNIDAKTYQSITTNCLICGYGDVVELHHLDKNKKNNSESNLIGLCPNHHKKIHMIKFRKEVIDKLNEVFKSKSLPEFKDNQKYFYKDDLGV
jgi:predicted nucleic-acid-binding Zn-ribbon protein